MSERVALAYSGGLDSSVAIGRLAEETEVVAVAVDLGLGGEDLATIRRRALDCGAVDAVVVDARDDFANDYCLPAVRANTLCHADLARAAVVRHLVDAAAHHGATAVAHGCVHSAWFEVGIGVLAPDLAVHAPVRDLASTPEQAIRGAGERAVPIDVAARSPYSVQRTVWSRVVEPGAPAPRIPVDLYDPDEVVVTFDRGVPVALDGETVTAFQAVRELNRRAGEHGVGRLDGVRSAPGAVALITAHQALEDVTLDGSTVRRKRAVEREWSGLVRDGLWFSPHGDALGAFIDTTQEHVSGEVRIVLHGGRVVVDDHRVEPSYDFPVTDGDGSDTVVSWGLPSNIAVKRI